MWILYAFGSALFAGATSILAKIGIEDVDSHVATALRTIVVLIFSWLMVFIVGSQSQLVDISIKSYIFLILSGMATGASWLCYFKALQLGDVNKVVPIDKSSTILTMVLAFIFLKEDITVPMVIGMIAIGLGTYLMIQKKEEEQKIAAQRAENCKRAQAAKAGLDSGMRVARMNDKGEREVLDDAARAAELERTQAIIQADCK